MMDEPEAVEYQGDELFEVLQAKYEESEAHARRILEIAVEFTICTFPHPRGYIKVEPVEGERGKFRVTEEFVRGGKK